LKRVSFIISTDVIHLVIQQAGYKATC